MKNNMHLNKFIFSLLLFTWCLSSFAQQNKVDSVINLLNISLHKNTLDTITIGKAEQIIYRTSFTDNNQIHQIDSIAILLGNKWPNDAWPHYILLGIFSNAFKGDFAKTIAYGKLQIEKLDKINLPWASTVKDYYLMNLRFPFRNSTMLDDGFKYYTLKLNDYKIKKDSVGLRDCYFVLAGFYNITGLTDLAIYNIKKSISYIDSLSNKEDWTNHVGVLGYYYLNKGNRDECLKYSKMSYFERAKSNIGLSFVCLNMAKMMLVSNETDSALYYLNLANTDSGLINSNEDSPQVLQTEALLRIQTGELDSAEALLKKCWQIINENKIPVNAAGGTMAPDYYLALIRIKQNKFDEAIALLYKDIERLLNNRLDKLRDYKLIAELYNKAGQHNRASETYATYIAMKDSLLADQDKYRSYSFEAEQQMSEKQLEITNLESKNKIASLSRNFSIGIAVLLLLIAAGIYNRFYTKKKANQVLENTLSELKSTQQQLIQSEKLAALGTVATRMAHEIQNPLNFVNNFSELSKELVSDVAEAKTEEEKNDALKTLQENIEKINQHGKRASTIVSQLQEHSNKGTTHEFFGPQTP